MNKVNEMIAVVARKNERDKKFSVQRYRLKLMLGAKPPKIVAPIL